jgi:hypothetical protein
MSALGQSRPSHFAPASNNVRFTPESGRGSECVGCPLCGMTTASRTAHLEFQPVQKTSTFHASSWVIQPISITLGGNRRNPRKQSSAT